MAGVNPLLVLTVAALGLLVAVTFGILVSREWYDYKPTLRPESQSLTSAVVESPIAWAAGFLLVSIVFAGAAGYWAIAPEAMRGTLSAVVIAVIGVLIALMVFTGVYEAIRTRGRSNSEAVGAGVVVLALLFVLTIAAQLVLA